MSGSPHKYRPRTPEMQSAWSIWALRVELMLAIALALIVIVRFKLPPESGPTAVTPPTMQPFATWDDAANEQVTRDDGPDAAKGRALFMQSCTSCHGPNAEGLPRMGPNLRQSRFIAQTSDLRLIAFLKSGRPATDPKNTTGIPMPPRGGNLALGDDALADIVEFLRQVQK